MPNHLNGVRWSTAPQEGQKGENLRIIRAPQSGTLRVMILSHQVTGTMTHYTNGRTQPCMGKGCPSCAQATPARWHGWLIVLNEASDEKMILEITEGPGETLAAFYSEHRTLRGLRVKLSRPSGKQNGRVHMLRGDQVTNHAELPKCPDLQKVLLKIWGLTDGDGLAVVGDGGPPHGDLPGQTYIGNAVG